jgi:dTDP-4-dehydrorhamnose 3,5-epimerase
MIKDVIVTRLDVIDTFGGNIMHGMKENDAGYAGFGEAYFSKIDMHIVKAWKRHKNMTLNLMVPMGVIKFVMFDDRTVSKGQFQTITISEDNYCRLTIPPMVWFGFQGLFDTESILLNIADIRHNAKELDHLKINKINYDWSVN